MKYNGIVQRGITLSPPLPDGHAPALQEPGSPLPASLLGLTSVFLEPLLALDVKLDRLQHVLAEGGSCELESIQVTALTVPVDGRIVAGAETEELEDVALVHAERERVLRQRVGEGVLGQEFASAQGQGPRIVTNSRLPGIEHIRPDHDGARAVPHPPQELPVGSWQGPTQPALELAHILVREAIHLFGWDALPFAEELLRLGQVHRGCLLPPDATYHPFMRWPVARFCRNYGSSNHEHLLTGRDENGVRCCGGGGAEVDLTWVLRA